MTQNSAVLLDIVSIFDSQLQQFLVDSSGPLEFSQRYCKLAEHIAREAGSQEESDLRLSIFTCCAREQLLTSNLGSMSLAAYLEAVPACEVLQTASKVFYDRPIRLEKFKDFLNDGPTLLTFFHDLPTSRISAI
jgi:hypothetical protein